MNGLTPKCPYCGDWSAKVTGADIYRGRPDLSHKTFYRCDPCNAHVGCHPGTDTPLGTLANRELRRARSSAHKAFDPLWRNAEHRGEARRAAYARLAEALGIDGKDCHIAHFDEAQCARVVEIVNSGELHER